MSDKENQPAVQSKQVPSIPKNIYKLKCVDAQDAESQQGNKNHKLIMEFAPKNGNPTMVNGVCIDGVKIYANSAITVKSLFYINKTRSAFGLAPLEAENVLEAQAAEYIGNECFAICSGKTEENKAEDGTIMRDPYTDEPLMISKREVLEFLPRPGFNT